jgi:hypothetical protein
MPWIAGPDPMPWDLTPCLAGGDGGVGGGIGIRPHSDGAGVFVASGKTTTGSFGINWGEMRMQIKLELRNFAITVAFLALISAAIYSILVDVTKDALFLALVPFVPMLVATVVSPNKNILLGAKKLRFYHWALVVIGAYLATQLGPDLALDVLVAHMFSFAGFFLAFLIITFRDKAG